ncbi:hypothetical protein Zm00014a_008489 [Zea mays]|uniref:Uncharacterized protein n=1 Tax=Zea mays TaxID=4577 RepID=A0A3L6E639_MAIZE|nr:hypothetical protein Zm00014a_008489 [Zea mays]
MQTMSRKMMLEVEVEMGGLPVVVSLRVDGQQADGTHGLAVMLELLEALRRQEEYNKQQQEYWAAQFARQQEMMQQIALGQRPDFSAMTMPPPPPIPQFVPTPQFSWPTPAPQVPPGNLLTSGNEDSEDAVASFVDGLLNSGGASGSNQPHPFDQPPPFE